MLAKSLAQCGKRVLLVDAEVQADRVQDGERVVYVMGNSVMPDAVPITLGASSETMSEVLDGDLKVGDLIVLNPPVYFDMNDSGPPFTMGGP